jgi:hypothetical protein
MGVSQFLHPEAGLPPIRSIDTYNVTISTPGGRVATYQINRHVPIKLGSFIFKTTLLIMGLDSVDIILGTDWLSRHHAMIDVAARAIEIHSPLDDEITLYLPDQG